MLEKLIKILAELVAAINANTAALQANAGSASEEGQAADADDATDGLPEEGEEPEPEDQPKAKAKKATKPAPVADEEPEGVSLNDLRAVASELLGRGKAAELKAVLAKFKAESLTKLNEKHYAAVLAALKKI